MGRREKMQRLEKSPELTIQRQEFPKELDILLRFLREPTTSSIVPKICSIKRTYLGGVCQSTA